MEEWRNGRKKGDFMTPQQSPVQTRLNFELDSITDKIVALSCYNNQTYIIYSVYKGKLLKGEFDSLKVNLVKKLQARNYQVL